MRLAARRSAVQAAGDAQRQLHALVIAAPEVLRERLRTRSTRQLVAACARLRVQASWDVKTATTIATPHSLARRIRELTSEAADHRQAILACRPGGIVSVIGVYGGLMDKFPTGAFMNKGLQMRTGQCHVQKYMPQLYEHIRKGDIDPSFIITHRMELGQAPQGYETFKHKQDECVKVVLKP